MQILVSSFNPQSYSEISIMLDNICLKFNFLDLPLKNISSNSFWKSRKMFIKFSIELFFIFQAF